jgi:hypothetical protein
MVYADLEALAAARACPEEAAAWRAKKEAKLAALERLAQGDASPPSSTSPPRPI